MAISLEVWGDFACFSRPELKVERVSYDVMTPSAARGLIESIYWHPGLKIVPDRIRVCNPIRFSNLRRNEVKSVINKQTVKTAMEHGHAEQLYISTSDDIQQRAAMLLRDVRYIIDAHFELVPEKMAPGDNAGKFQDILTRRIEKGQFYHQPYFGCREFPVNFKPFTGTYFCPEELKGTRDLGWMLYDMDYSDPANILPGFFRASLLDGVLNIPAPDSQEVHR